MTWEGYCENETLINETLCCTSKAIASDKAFAFFLFLEIFISLAAFIANVLLAATLPYVSVFHPNLRILLVHMSLNLMGYSAAYLAKGVVLLHSMFASVDPCRLVANAFSCKLKELTSTVPIGNTVFTSIFLCAERFHSTIRYRQYDSAPARTWLSAVAIAVTWCIVLTAQLTSLFSIDRDKTVPVCESLISMNAEAAANVLVINFLVELATVVVIVLLHFWNNIKLKKILLNRAQHTLNARFQISQNVSVNAMMMPSMVFQCVCYVPNYVFLLVVIVGVPLDTVTKTWLIHVNYMWKLIYALAHPLLAFKRNAHVVEQFKKRSPKWIMKILRFVFSTGKTASVSPVRTVHATDASRHFQVLDQMWATAPPQRAAGAYHYRGVHVKK